MEMARNLTFLLIYIHIIIVILFYFSLVFFLYFGIEIRYTAEP